MKRGFAAGSFANSFFGRDGALRRPRLSFDSSFSWRSSFFLRVALMRDFSADLESPGRVDYQ
jgi:hypothetical protein